MLGNTNSHVLQNSGGGGDTIYLENESGATLSAGDKVLCNLGSVGSSTPTSFTHSTSGNFNPILFFDNSSFVTSDDNTGYLHVKSDGVWSSTSNNLYDEWAESAIYTYHANGVIAGKKYLGDTGASTYIYTKTGKVELPSNSIYLGEYNDVHYCATSTDYYVKIYNKTANTIGSTVATFYTGTYQYIIWGKIISNLCFVENSAGVVGVYEISNEGTFTLLKQTAISGYVLYVTGVGGSGDYVLVTDSKAAYQHSNSSPNGHLFCYRIESDYSLTLVSVPALQQFESTACFVCYDNRNNLLSIGTKTGVYFYEFEYVHNLFINKNSVIDTYPTNSSNYPYKTMMSPDMNTIVIVGYGNYVNVYDLTTPYHRIVPNSAYNYNLTTSLTGFATGETDSAGKYEVSTVLPEVVNFGVVSKLVEPDEVNIYGGAE